MILGIRPYYVTFPLNRLKRGPRSDEWKVVLIPVVERCLG